MLYKQNEVIEVEQRCGGQCCCLTAGGLGFISDQGLSEWSLHVLLVLAQVFCLPPTVKKTCLLGELATLYCPGVAACLSLYVSPVMNGQFVQGVPHLSPYYNWDRLQTPLQP